MTALFSNRWIKWISILILILLVIFSILPFVWMVSTSIKNSSELYTSIPKLLPNHPTFKNFSYIMQRGSFGLYFRNSFLVGMGTTIASLFVSLLAGYGFSRYHFPGHKFVLFSFLMVQMFPSVLLIIPLFRLINAFDLMNTMRALILANTTFAVPLCTWLLKGFFDQIPHDLEEAAMIDGCSRIGAMVRVILPLTLPGIIASGIYIFIGSWDELVYAMTFTSSEAIRTLPVGLSRFITSYEIQWNQLAAATVLATVPVLILFVFIQKYIAQGLISGSVKG